MNFMKQLTNIINTGQSRSVILTGNIYDLFHDGTNWVPLINLLQSQCKLERTENQKGITQIIYQVNRPIEVIGDSNLNELAIIWQRFNKDKKLLSEIITETLDNSVYGLEILRQITECARRGRYKNNLVIIIEAAEMLLPHAEISQMSIHDRKRVSIVQDWFGDPDFCSGHDTVILLSESRNAIHKRISRLPQVLSLEVPLPDATARYQFILHHPASDTYKQTEKKEHVCSLADESTSG